MAYFIPSSIQKRLLRYALSRLELLDTDALDLDRLDIAWGRRSTAELKDVGLRKAKLSSLLQLPGCLSIEKAGISLLRLTVPADIQTSSVVVEVEGVRAKVKVLDDDIQSVQTNKTSATRRSSRKSRSSHNQRDGAGREQKSHTANEWPRYSMDEQEDEEQAHLPTTHDLAASFLAEEPQEEMEELEAAFNSKSTSDLRQSLAFSDASDEDLAYGTGVGFTLPGFLADFLTGITNRLQITVKDVDIEFEIDLDIPSEDSSEPAITPTTISLHLDEIEFGSVELYPKSDPGFEPTPSPTTPDQNVQQSEKSWKRRILLRHISGTIATEAAVFEQLSKVFDGGESISGARRSPVSSWPKPQNGLAQMPPSIDSRASITTRGELFSRQAQAGEAQSYRDTLHEERNGFEEASEGAHTSRSNRMAAQTVDSLLLNRPTLGAGSTASMTSDEMFEESHQHGVVESLQLDASRHIHDSLQSFSDNGLSSTSHSVRQRPVFRTASPPPFTSGARLRSTSPLVRIPGGFQTTDTQVEDYPGQFDSSDPTLAADEPAAGNSPAGSSPGEDDDMFESKLFSHEDAESLYMSAIGGDDSTETKTEPGLDTFPQREGGSVGQAILRVDSLQRAEPIEPTRQSEDQPESVASKPTRPTGLVVTSQQPNLYAKELFSVDLAELYLAVHVENKSDVPDGDQYPAYGDTEKSVLSRSTVQQIPGAFSMYAESSTSRRNQSSTTHATNFAPNRDASTSTQGTPKSQGQYPPEIISHTARVCFDLSTCRLFFQLHKRLQTLFGENDEKRPQRKSAQDTSKSGEQTSNAFRVCCQKATLFFFENIEHGNVIADTPIISSSRRENHPAPEGILFISEVERVRFSAAQEQLRLDSKLEIGKFTLGFWDEDILSFSREARMRTSLRDIREVQHNDVDVTFKTSEAGTDINVSTLPLKISIDLQRVDDAFSNFGGLSGLLELGSSIMSEATVTNETPQRSNRPRAVHFDVPQKASPAPPRRRSSKLNLRLGGISMSLYGKKCSVTYQASAVKVVGRDALIAAQIDDMRFSGPYFSSHNLEPPITTRVRNTSLKYLFSPEEHDLTRLISLLTPSKDKFQEDDDFLVDTLVRQRRKGAVLRISISQMNVNVGDLRGIDTLQELVAEMSKMPNVTKYLPQESRPGVLTLGMVDTMTVAVQTGRKLGEVEANLQHVELAHVGLPSLIAFAIARVVVDREGEFRMLGEVLPQQAEGQPPMVMARMIGDDLEPALKFKLWNVCFEYTVPLVMAILDLKDEPAEDEEVDLAASISNLAGRGELSRTKTFSSEGSDQSTSSTKLFRFDFAARDCAIALNPHNKISRALFVLSDSRITTSLPFKDSPTLKIELNKAAMLIIDDRNKLSQSEAPSSVRFQASTGKHQISDLCRQGYVSVCSISAASAVMKLVKNPSNNDDSLDIEFRDELFVLETCADSTQTLIETLGALAPPMPPSKGQKYRTEIAPIEDMMASFTGDAYALRSVEDSALEDTDDQDFVEALDDEDLSTDFDRLGDLGQFDDEIQQSEGDITFRDLGAQYAHPVRLQPMQGTRKSSAPDDEFVTGEIQLGPLPPQVQGMANKWDSANNRYIQVNKVDLAKSPLKVRIRDVHLIWNLYDGYDWERTRETITKAVQTVEARAEEKRAARRLAVAEDDEEESVIGDFLFNSIYIGIPVSNDPKDLSRQINHNINDVVSETGTHTSTVTSAQSNTHRSPRRQGRRLKLERSKGHKVAIELGGLSVDLFTFASGEETQSSIDVRVQDLEIFDHVPTSTWKKFATYMQDAGPREEKKPMVHLEICNVRPVPELTATELVIRVTVLPLRLHVDQDALDFITRFFEFSDESQTNNSAPAEQPYLQRVEVRPVPIKLDYKPKNVDYAGLRSGRTTEFMNFFILDGADILLKHAIIYGCSGFLKLHHSLEDVWMPDVKRNQLPSVLSGLNGVRTLVNVGTGVRDLVVIPIREYKKDGRIVRSISKGAVAFAKSTGSELTRFGAKLAVGAQNALQGAEGFFAKPAQESDAAWEIADLDPEERRVISHYAEQPTGILQGLKGAARSLERDLLLTKDIIIAVAGEIRESGSAEGAARAVARHAPTLILRPMIGASKAVSQTLMGATNTVDPTNRRRIEDKYKRY